MASYNIPKDQENLAPSLRQKQDNVAQMPRTVLGVLNHQRGNNVRHKQVICLVPQREQFYLYRVFFYHSYFTIMRLKF